LKPGDVAVGLLPGAAETKVRPAVVIASDIYLVERPDVLVGILTTKLPRPATSTAPFHLRVSRFIACQSVKCRQF
jgi:mRNA-degrading endonuclease toxin of MazEF toxin-antitoxin module